MQVIDTAVDARLSGVWMERGVVATPMPIGRDEPAWPTGHEAGHG